VVAVRVGRRVDPPPRAAQLGSEGDDTRAEDDPTPLDPPPASEAVQEAELGGDPEGRPERPAPRRFARAVPLLAVGLGGVLGAEARYAVGLWAVARWGASFPWATLLVNVAGSLVLGFYLTLVTERFSGRSTTRLFVATGFLGAFTTFSTFSYETLALVRMGAFGLAATYVAASLAAGLAAAVFGVLAAHAL